MIFNPAVEADLVAHFGESAAGSFLHTQVLVDVATGWTECVADWRQLEFPATTWNSPLFQG